MLVEKMNTVSLRLVKTVFCSITVYQILLIRNSVRSEMFGKYMN